MKMKRLAALCLLFSAHAFAQPTQPKQPAAQSAMQPTQPKQPAAQNAIQREMQALHGLVLAALSGIETGDLSAVETAIEVIHQAATDTEKALKSGQYTPPKKGTTAQDFIRQDEAFHPMLVQLLVAARKKDVAATARALGPVLQGCAACHLKFRLQTPTK